MSRKSYPNVNAANQYARDVVRGKIVACQYVIDACQRHIDDMAQEKGRKFRYRFDKDLAEQAAKFIQLLPHTKGEWAFKRMPITLEPWQLFIVCCAFGWVQKGTKLRRFREVYTEIPRKNGKSAISAGVALYCFTCDNEFGAEVYSGATTEKQAWEVFRPAKLMCKRTPLLTEAFGIEVNAKNMNRPEDGARFEPLIGDPGDGQSPHCAIVDEYHEHDTDSLYTTMLTGMGARRQPLMWAITTAGYNIEGPCYDKRREVIEMLNGTVPNDELFGVIYTVDDGDDWTDPNTLKKAKPFSITKEMALLSTQLRRVLTGTANTMTLSFSWVQLFRMEKWLHKLVSARIPSVFLIHPAASWSLHLWLRTGRYLSVQHLSGMPLSQVQKLRMCSNRLISAMPIKLDIS